MRDSLDRIQVEGVLGAGRGDYVPEEGFWPHERIAYEVVEAAFQANGKTADDLSPADGAKLAGIARYFISGGESFLARVAEPHRAAAFARYPRYLAERERIHAMAEARTAHVERMRRAGRVQRDEGGPVDVRALPGPDIHLWHALATESHDFDAWEWTIWWNLAQSDCDRATVAEFLVMFVAYEFLDGAARGGMQARLDGFGAVIARRNAGFYPFQSLTAGALLTSMTADGFAAGIARIRADTGAQLPDLPAGVFARMQTPADDLGRHVASGWGFASTLGLFPTAL